MFITRLRRKTQIRRRKGGRETLAEDAVRFQDIVVSKTRAKGVAVPSKLMRELQRGSEQQDGGRRLYKLDLRRIHLTDAHVEALTEALQELPVVRKLDFRGNDDMTVRTLKALNSLLKGQVELFRLVQADASLADSSLSFLYSVKLDPVVLSLDRAAAEELETHTAALEVADSVLDVRHAFFEADIRESGTLTEHELSDAMRSIMGSTPKAGETSRVLRFFGQPGAEGRDPTVINLGGFEAAMVGRLRESHTLPVLPQGCDELLFGSVEDKGSQKESSQCFSPWSTRSFGATTGNIRDSMGSGKAGGGGGGVEHKRSPLSASQDFRSAAGMRTQVPPLPPWRGGSELDTTQKDNDGEGGESVGNGFELEDIFDDGGGNGTGEQDVSPRSGAKAGRAIVGSGNGHGGREKSEHSRHRSSIASETYADEVERRASAAARDNLQKQEVDTLKLKDRLPDTVRLKRGLWNVEDPVLTEGSSDDDSSCNSPRTQSKRGVVTGGGTRLWNDELIKYPGDESSAVGLSDWRRHSSGPTPSVQNRQEGDSRNSGSIGSGSGSGGDGRKVSCLAAESNGGRRVSDTPRIYHVEVDSAGAKVGAGASTSEIHGRQRSNLTGHHDDDTALTRSSEKKTGQAATDQSSVQARRDGAAAVEQQSPHSSVSASYQAATDGKDILLRGEKVTAALSGINALTGGVTCSALSSTAGVVGAGPAKQRGHSPTSPPTTPDGGATSIPAGQAPPGSSGEETHPTRRVSFGVDDRGDSRTVMSGALNEAVAAAEVPGDNGQDTKGTTAGAHTANLREIFGAAVARTPSVVSGELSMKDASGVAQKGELRREHQPVAIAIRETLSRQLRAVAETDESLLASTSQSFDQRPGERHPSVTNIAAPTDTAKSHLSPRRSRCDGEPTGAAAVVSAAVVPAQAMGLGRNAQTNPRGPGVAGNGVATSEPNLLRLHPGTTEALPQKMPGLGTEVLAGREDGDFTGESRNLLVGTSGGAMAALSLEAISGGPTEASCGDGCGSGGAQGGAAPAAATTGGSTLDLDCGGGVGVGAGGVGGGGAIRKPYCLSPTNVVQGRSDAPTGTGASCRERERLAARIQLSADNEVAAVAAAAPFVNAASHGNPPGLSPSGTAYVADSGFTSDAEGVSSKTGSGLPDAKELNARPLSMERKPRSGAGSPEDGDHSSDRWRAGDDGPVAGRGYPSSPSPSSRFHLPSSETKTAPLCGVGGSTSLYEGSAITSKKSTASFRGGGGEAWCFSRVDCEAGLRAGAGGAQTKGGEGAVMDDGGGMGSSSQAVLREDEEQVAIRLNEGALVISRSGLAKMGVILELEAVQERGRDSLIGLHTLVLSCNRLQVLDISVLATMPSLRHLDVSHNLLCRMEPMEGRDLPPRLQTLNMSHNRISRIGGIGHCFLLRVVDLRNNRIKRVQGLEHLSLLEQLDLGHNLISKAASARALSFNRSLKLLWLGGNPLARHPRYRPTLTCLLPHVRSIDSRGMPPSSNSEQRRWTAEVLTGEEGESDEYNGTVSNSMSVSREWQAEQDERRSKAWRQAARQRRQAKELARPRARTCPSEEAISKAKEVASHRPAVVFGISYRGEKESDDYPSRVAYMPPASASIADAPPSPPATRRQQQLQGRLFNTTPADGFGSYSGRVERGGGRDGGDSGGGGGGLREAKVESDRGLGSRDDAALFGDVFGSREIPMLGRDDDEARQRSHEEGGEGDGSSLLLPPSARIPSSSRCSATLPAVSATGGYDRTSSSVPESATVVVDKGREATPRIVEFAQKGAGGREGFLTEHPEAVVCKRNELVDSWLLDVRLETETAGTALQVLLKMCKERGRDPEGEQRRLSSFHTALEGMGLFSSQHGPMPTRFGRDEGGVLAQRVTSAARQVAMTKAAVKNLLRLMQSVGPGEDGRAELDQYIEFIRQQIEIMVGSGDHHGPDTTSPSAKREPVTAGAGAVQPSRSVDYHDNSTSGQEGQENAATGVPPSTETAAIGNSMATTGLLSAPVLVATGIAVRDPSARTSNSLMANDATVALSEDVREKDAEAVEIKQVGQGKHQVPPVAAPNDAGLLAIRSADDIPVPRAANLAAPASLVVAVDVVPTCPPGSDAVVPEALLMGSQGISTWEAKQTELAEEAARETPSVLPVDPERGSLAKTIGEGGSCPIRETELGDVSSLVSTRESIDPDSTLVHEETGEGKGVGKEEIDNNGASWLSSIAAISSSLTSGGSSRAPVPSGNDVDDTDTKTAVVVSMAEAAVAEEKRGEKVLAAAAPAAVSADANLSARERLLRHLQATKSPRSVSDDDSSCSSVGGGDDAGNADKNEGEHQPAESAVVQDERVVTPAQEDGSQGGCDVSPSTPFVGNDNAVMVADQKAELGESQSRAETPESQEDSSRALTTRLAKIRQDGTGTGGGETSKAAYSNDGSGGLGVPSTTRSTNHLAPTQLVSVVASKGDGAVSPATLQGSAGSVRDDGLDVGVSDPAKVNDKHLENGMKHGVLCGTEERVANARSAGEPPNTDGLASPGASTAAVVSDETIIDGAKTVNGDGHLGGSSMDDADNVAPTTTNDDGRNNQNLTVTETASPAEEEQNDDKEGKTEPGIPEAAAPGVGAALKTASEEVHIEKDARSSTTGSSQEKTSTKSRGTEKDSGEVAAGGAPDRKADSGGDGDTKRESVENPTTAENPTAELEWIEGYDPGHDCYYYHHIPTGESRWYKPDEPYEPYVHSDEEDGDLVVTALVGDEQTAGTRAVAEADAAPGEDDGRRRDRRKKSKHSGNGDEKRNRKGGNGLEEEDEWEAEATNARSSSSRRDKDSSTGRRRSSQSRKTSKSSRRRRGDDDGASSPKARPDSGRSLRHRREKTALERLNDLTDDNTCGSDDLRSDDGGRGGGRGGRRSGDSSRRRDSRGSRRHRQGNGDDRDRSSRKRGGSGGGSDGDDRDKESRRGRIRGHHSSSRKKSHRDDEEDDVGSHAGKRSSGSRYSKTLLSSDGSVSGGGGDGSDRIRGVSSVRGGSRGGSGSRRSSVETKGGRGSTAAQGRGDVER